MNRGHVDMNALHGDVNTLKDKIASTPSRFEYWSGIFAIITLILAVISR